MNGLGEQANNPSQSIGYSQLNCKADEGGGVEWGGPDGAAGPDDKLHPVATCMGNEICTYIFMLSLCFLRPLLIHEGTC